MRSTCSPELPLVVLSCSLIQRSKVSRCRRFHSASSWSERSRSASCCSSDAACIDAALSISRATLGTRTRVASDSTVAIPRRPLSAQVIARQVDADALRNRAAIGRFLPTFKPSKTCWSPAIQSSIPQCKDRRNCWRGVQVHS